MPDSSTNRDRRHVRGTRIYAPNAIYHLRTSTINRRPFFANGACCRIALAAIRHVSRAFDFELLAYVIMPDHLHLVVQPRGSKNISEFMASFKKYSARSINQHLGRSGPVWRREFFDHVLRTREHLDELADYVHDNPVRRGLVQNASGWPFSSWGELYGDDHPPKGGD
jgi:REP element-mobilizing transposase RayT